MIRDCQGTELKPGNMIQVMLPQGVIRGRITGLREGGMVIADSSSSAQRGVTPDMVIIEQQIACIDSPPGQPHGSLLRIVDPETEQIVKKGH
jgi:hypothetical protein